MKGEARDGRAPEFGPERFRTDAHRRLRLDKDTKQSLRRLERQSARGGRLSPLPYNLSISHRHQFMWFRVAKVGTRTIHGHLHEHQVPLDVDHAMRMRYPTRLFADYFKFAFVRHPLDRFVSAWSDKVVAHNYYGFADAELDRMQRIEAFAEWSAGHDLADLSTTDQHLVLQSRMVDLTQVDYVGRLESFDEDFAQICRRIEVPAWMGATRNRSKEGQPAVSAELEATIAELYRVDFQIFGYSRR